MPKYLAVLYSTADQALSYILYTQEEFTARLLAGRSEIKWAYLIDAETGLVVASSYPVSQKTS